jgi:uncharacterized repeat protein (TIGR02543 family)
LVINSVYAVSAIAAGTTEAETTAYDEDNCLRSDEATDIEQLFVLGEHFALDSTEITLKRLCTDDVFFVRFMPHTGTDEIGSIFVTSGTSLTEPPEYTAPEHFTFKGYSGGTNVWTGTPALTVTENLTLTATVAEKVYKVTFINGEAEPALVEKTYDEEITTADIPEPTPASGYVFDGWYTAADGTGAKFTYGSTPTADITYYAVFVLNSYTVTFDGFASGGYTIGTTTYTNDGNGGFTVGLTSAVELEGKPGKYIVFELDAAAGKAITAINVTGASATNDISTNDGFSTFSASGTAVTLQIACGSTQAITISVTVKEMLTLTIDDGLTNLGTALVPASVSFNLSKLAAYAGITADIAGYWDATSWANTTEPKAIWTTGSTVEEYSISETATLYANNKANIYLQSNSKVFFGANDDAGFWAYYFTGSINEPIKMQLVLTGEDSNLYAIARHAQHQNVLFVRMSNAQSSFDWGGAWGQTTDQTLISDNVFKTTARDGANKNTGTWSLG